MEDPADCLSELPIEESRWHDFRWAASVLLCEHSSTNLKKTEKGRESDIQLWFGEENYVQNIKWPV